MLQTFEKGATTEGRDGDEVKDRDVVKLHLKKEKPRI